MRALTSALAASLLLLPGLAPGFSLLNNAQNLVEALRWSPATGLAGGIQVSVEPGFAAQLGAVTPADQAALNQAVLAAFAMWESPVLDFQVSLESPGAVEGVTNGSEIDLMQAGADDAMRLWIQLIHDTVAREKKLVAVFLYQVPYTNQLDPIRAIGARQLEFSQQVRWHAGGFVQADFSDATLHLVINLVTSTIMQLVFDPPSDVTRRELLDELTRRLEEWIRGDGFAAGAGR